MMLALVARRLKLSCNVLYLRNLHCRPSEQCQNFNHNNDESVESKRYGGRCGWNLRGCNPNINFSGSDQYTKIVSHTLGNHCWCQSVVSGHFNTSEWQSLDQNSNNIRQDETKTIAPKRFPGKCDWNSSNPYNSQCILKRYAKQKKRKHCNCEFLNWDQWSILKWTTGFIGSYYASKLLCLYARRRNNIKEWKCMEKALAERQKIQKEVLENHYGISKLQKSHVPKDKHIFNWSEIPDSFLYDTTPVTNDHHMKQTKITINTQATHSFHVEKPAVNGLSVAIDDLKLTISHLEFVLGVQSLKEDRPEVAVHFFTKATVHNHPEATYNLGVCYEKGIGTSINLKEAKECYRAAANLGHAKSMYNLGVFFAQGKGGLKKSRKAAKFFFNEASRLGSKEAKKALGIRFVKSNDASHILADKSCEIVSELNPVHRAGLSVVV